VYPGLARLVEHLAMRIEPAVRILLKKDLAARSIELVIPAFVSKADLVGIERTLAYDAHRRHQIGSSSRSG